MDLSGTWKATPADDELRRRGVGLDVDDSTWVDVAVPGHWRSQPEFADHDGPLLYRTRFDDDVPEPGQRRWVVFDGIFYQADIWLDGAYLGDPEGYFAPHSYDITALTRLGREHSLAVEVACPPPSDPTAKRSITGVFQHGHGINPHGNPGGIWRPVRIETTGPVRIDRLRVLCRDADESRANLRLFARLDSDEANNVVVRTFVDGQLVAHDARTVAAGPNDMQWNVDVEQPRLWWPWALGTQDLVEVRVEVEVNGASSHQCALATGLREVSLQNWGFTVNGERLFVKGANMAPTRSALGEASVAELRRDVELAREAGLDMIRLQAHISRPELYDEADRLGMLVWQDFPLQWGYSRQIRRSAVEQAEEAVWLLGHHPSIVLWCAHNEPMRTAIAPGSPTEPGRATLPLLASHQLPNWNKSVLDRWVKRAFEKADPTRPVIAHSGVLPHLPQIDGTDTHLWLGWYHGDERELPGLAASLPRLVRFVGEFGAQAVPDSADFMDPSSWPDLDWERLADRFGYQTEVFARRVPPADFDSFDDWRDATQAYQALVVKHQIETLRRLKYQPTGGFNVSTLNDAEPMVSFSLLDHDRHPKLAYQALTDACRPVIVVADRLPAQVPAGAGLALDVHAVSDLREPLTGAVVTAELTWTGGAHRWQWQGDVDADACVAIGTIQFLVPHITGAVELDLTLEAGEIVATNRYRTIVTG